MTDPTTSTVASADIARLAGVGRAAVSNWRRRFADFPSPVGGTAASPLYRLADVEGWLRTHGRAAAPGEGGREGSAAGLAPRPSRHGPGGRHRDHESFVGGAIPRFEGVPGELFVYHGAGFYQRRTGRASRMLRSNLHLAASSAAG